MKKTLVFGKKKKDKRSSNYFLLFKDQGDPGYIEAFTMLYFVYDTYHNFKICLNNVFLFIVCFFQEPKFLEGSTHVSFCSLL